MQIIRTDNTIVTKNGGVIQRRQRRGFQTNLKSIHMKDLQLSSFVD